MLTCGLKTQINELIVETFCWNSCIEFNFLTSNQFDYTSIKEIFLFLDCLTFVLGNN